MGGVTGDEGGGGIKTRPGQVIHQEGTSSIKVLGKAVGANSNAIDQLAPDASISVDKNEISFPFGSEGECFFPPSRPNLEIAIIMMSVENRKRVPKGRGIDLDEETTGVRMHDRKVPLLKLEGRPITGAIGVVERRPKLNPQVTIDRPRAENRKGAGGARAS